MTIRKVVGGLCDGREDLKRKAAQGSRLWRLQRDASIEDQERRCREYAARESGPIVEEYVVAHSAISGASVAGRDGLVRLMEAAKRKQKPFDCLLIYETARFARDLPDLLRSIDILKYYGVAVVSVAEGIDSAQPIGRQMFVVQGMHAEQFLAALRPSDGGAPDRNTLARL